MKKGIFLIMCLFIISCTTVPVPIDQAIPVPKDRLYAFQTKTSETSSTIIAIRDSGMVGSGCYCGFYINDVLAGRFDTSEIAKFHIEPGEITLKLGADPQGKGLCGGYDYHYIKRESYIKSGETKRFNLRLMATGTPDIQRAD